MHAIECHLFGRFIRRMNFKIKKDVNMVKAILQGLLLIILITAHPGFSAQSKPKKAKNKYVVIIDSLINKFYVKCGPYTCSKFVFESGGYCLSMTKGFSYKIEPNPISEADKMNGIQYSADVLLQGSVSKNLKTGRDSDWSEWREDVGAWMFVKLINGSINYSFEGEGYHDSVDCSIYPTK